MAGNIKGITIEIGGDTTGLDKALKGVNTQAKTAQNNLKEVEKALKLDPGNTELLEQKQRALADAKSSRRGCWKHSRGMAFRNRGQLRDLQRHERRGGPLAALAEDDVQA